jgi:hypothetical protein
MEQKHTVIWRDGDKKVRGIYARNLSGLDELIGDIIHSSKRFEEDATIEIRIGESDWEKVAKELELENKGDDIRIRTVRVLGDRAKAEALKQGCKEDDLVIVTTIIEGGHLPRYEIEKIKGSPTKYLHDRILKSKEGN